MKRSTALIASGTVALVTTVIFSSLWPTAIDSNVSSSNAHQTPPKDASIVDPLASSTGKLKQSDDSPTNTPTSNSKTDPAISDNTLEKTPVDESLFNTYENDVVAETLQQVAGQYADNIRFPVNSQPVRNQEDVRAFRPFEQAQVSTPFPEGDNDENPIRIIAATDTFQYFIGETINIRVEVLDSSNSSLVSVDGTLAGSNGEITIPEPFTEVDQGSNIFTTSIDTKQLNSALLSPEMVAKLNVVVGNRDLNTTVPFRYRVAAAQISGVQQSRPEGPELIVPLELNVFEDGYYFVRGLLVDASNGRPLIQLQAESRLATGRGTINLNAHISALQAQQSEGPYLLQNISGYRGAEVGEALDTPTSVTQQQFNVDGFPFSDYDNEEFVDELAQERLDFLNSFGANNNSVQ